MMIRPSLLVLATLLCGGLLRAEPDKKPAKPAKPDAGISISVHDGKVEVDGVQDLVEEQLEGAFDSIDLDNVPGPVRAKLKERLGKLRGTIGARLKHLDAKDMDQLGKELDKMGEDIGKEMEGLGSDMDKWGKGFSKQFDKNWSKKLSKRIRIGHVDDDDDDDMAGVPDIDDDDDLATAASDLGDMKLAQPQKDQLAKLRVDSDKQVVTAKQALDAASKTLHDQLEGGKASDADIAKSIDAVTQQEAAIRKARILTWVHARGLLDADQRKKVETAAAKGKTR
jgi:hypothetical protein